MSAVTYNANVATSGTAPVDGSTYTTGDTVAVLSNSGLLAKTDYLFNGWNTAADGSGTHYAAGSSFVIGAASVTLYAEWIIEIAENALITIAEYESLIQAIEAAYVPKFQRIINQASARIELFTRRKLKARAYAALYLEGKGRDSLILPHYPVNSITHLYADSLRVFGSDTEILAADYSLDAEAGMIYLYDDTFPAGRGVIKLECNAGYLATSSEWQVLQMACIETVKWSWSRYSGFIGKRTETNADGMNTSYEIELPMNVRSMLLDFQDRRL